MSPTLLPRRPQPRRLASVRVKILTWVLVLTALGMTIALGATYVIENQRIRASVNAELLQEVWEFRQLATTGIDPDTGASFTSVEQLLRVTLQRNVPGTYEAFATFLNGELQAIQEGHHPFRIVEERAVMAQVLTSSKSDTIAFHTATSSRGEVRLAVVQVGVEGRQAAGPYVISHNLHADVVQSTSTVAAQGEYAPASSRAFSMSSSSRPRRATMAGMDETSTTFLSDADGMTIQATCWSPGVEPRAVVQIAHGMGEHSARYARFAKALTDAGYIVYTSDHRGHGRTAGSSERHGDLGEGGWQALVDDVGQLGRIARADNPGKKFALIGHSMGSFAAQQWVLDHSEDLDALVLSGSTAVDVIAAQLNPSAETDLSAFNEPFGDRTDFEWLSRDEAEVDRYVADEACGFGLNPAGTGGMIEGAMLTGQPERIDAIRKDLPILIASGDADPLAAGGDLIRLLESRYRDAGLTDVTVELYPEARHEILNETNRDEVTGDILAFLDRTIGR